MPAFSLQERPIHLGLGATAEAQPAFPAGDAAMEWYAQYAARHAGDGAEGRLVSMYRFTEDWTGWEMHPNGAEVVVCLEGRMDLIQQVPGEGERRVSLSPGEYAINPPGTWHTADIPGEALGLFITAGEGTQHRQR